MHNLSRENEFYLHEISISNAEHLPSFWNRGPGELGNGLFIWLRLSLVQRHPLTKSCLFRSRGPILLVNKRLTSKQVFFWLSSQTLNKKISLWFTKNYGKKNKKTNYDFDDPSYFRQVRVKKELWGKQMKEQNWKRCKQLLQSRFSSIKHCS